MSISIKHIPFAPTLTKYIDLYGTQYLTISFKKQTRIRIAHIYVTKTSLKHSQQSTDTMQMYTQAMRERMLF